MLHSCSNKHHFSGSSIWSCTSFRTEASCQHPQIVCPKHCWTTDLRGNDYQTVLFSISETLVFACSFKRRSALSLLQLCLATNSRICASELMSSLLCSMTVEMLLMKKMKMRTRQIWLSVEHFLIRSLLCLYHIHIITPSLAGITLQIAHIQHMYKRSRRMSCNRYSAKKNILKVRQF